MFAARLAKPYFGAVALPAVGATPHRSGPAEAFDCPDEPGEDGLGDWNIPWDQWRAGNANI